MYKTLYEDKTRFSEYKTGQQVMLHRISHYLEPFITDLTCRLDIRLVRTFYDAFVSIIIFRNASKGLLLSELGKYITGAQHSPAGTKRLSNLFRSKNWLSDHLEAVHLERAKVYVREQESKARRLLCFCDDSMIEKPESWFSEGLCPVYSSKAARLTRIKRGYYNKPTSRICVPGFEWTGMVIGSLGIAPILGLMKWWTTKGKNKECRDNIFYRLIKQIKENFGSSLTFVLDRGYADFPTLDRLTKHQQHFIIRWKNTLILKDGTGKELNTWRICHGKKGLHKRRVRDKERQRFVLVEIIYQAVFHPELPDIQLYLIVVRNKSFVHQQPMYLLTDIETDSTGIAWELFFSYIKRWDIEQAFRFNKSELGIQSCRLWEFENRLKVMALVTLVYDFLLQTWREHNAKARLWINAWCPRTGNKLREIKMPLYRLRAAFANAIELVFAKNSG